MLSLVSIVSFGGFYEAKKRGREKERQGDLERERKKDGERE